MFIQVIKTINASIIAVAELTSMAMIEGSML